MKELSIEEKAKRYDEALKEAVIAHKDEDRHLKATLERIFPELKESDDKRVKNKLIEFFKGYSPDKEWWGNITQRDILTWLEKQGEHANFLDKIQIGDKVTRNEDGVLVNLSQLNRIAKSAEKQGEQSKKHDVCDTCDEKDSCISPCCVKLVEEQGEQKPVGFNIGDEITVNGQVCRVVAVDKSTWSEEDEKMLVGCVQAMCTPDAYSLNDRINFEYWLKSLKDRVQPRPKKEWSEEEHQIIEDAASVILDCVNTVETKKEEERLEELVDKLQNLKPYSQWKPSDEQMYILNWVTNLLNDGMVEKHAKGILESLYNDLKKLKE